MNILSQAEGAHATIEARLIRQQAGHGRTLGNNVAEIEMHRAGQVAAAVLFKCTHVNQQDVLAAKLGVKILGFDQQGKRGVHG